MNAPLPIKPGELFATLAVIRADRAELDGYRRGYAEGLADFLRANYRRYTFRSRPDDLDVISSVLAKRGIELSANVVGSRVEVRLAPPPSPVPRRGFR